MALPRGLIERRSVLTQEPRVVQTLSLPEVQASTCGPSTRHGFHP